MAWIFGVLGGSFGLNALIKSNQQKSTLRHVALPTVVKINTLDITQVGIVATVACTLVSVLSSAFLLAMFIPKFNRRSSLKLESFSLLFATIMLFSSLIVFTDFYANRSAKITATLGTVIIPQAIIDKTAAALGQTSVYKDIDYLKWVTYIQWFTFLFATIATVVTFMAASRASPASYGRSIGPGSPDFTKVETEKQEVQQV
jgi:hypothetical protein